MKLFTVIIYFFKFHFIFYQILFSILIFLYSILIV